MGYARSQGVPARLGVLLSGLFPVLGGLAVPAFLVVATPTMHAFWAVDDPEQKQTEMTQFLKNVALAGGALVLFAIGTTAWPLALNLGL